MVTVILFEVQQHDDEEVEHQDGAGVHDDLDGGEEFRVERDIQPGDVKKHDQQGERTVDRVLQRDHQDGSEEDDAREVPKKSCPTIRPSFSLIGAINAASCPTHVPFSPAFAAGA